MCVRRALALLLAGPLLLTVLSSAEVAAACGDVNLDSAVDQAPSSNDPSVFY